MTEAALVRKIQKYCKENNIYEIKIWGGGFQRSGVPDLILCVDGYFVALETKVGKNKMSKLQEYNISQIKKCGGIATDCYDMNTFYSIIDSIRGKK